MKHLVVPGIVAMLFASPASGQDATKPATPQASKAEKETRYLAFQIFTYGPDPKVASMGEGMNPLARFPDKATLRDYIEDIKRRIGTVGDQQTRLAVVLGHFSFDHGDAEITKFIELAFSLALETDVAVGFHIDDSMFWARRKDLWSDRNNVEALDWDGTPCTGRRLDWQTGPGAKPDAAPPQMCFNSKVIQREVRQRSALLGKAIQEGVKQLQQRNRPELFAGVIAGSETMIGQDFKTGKYLGYRALLNRGFSREHPPQDLDLEREKVVQEFIELWTKGLAEAGVPPQKIYSHTAFLSRRVFNLGDNKATTYSQHNHFAPPSVAFGEHHRPGFSTYPQPGLFDDIYEELARHKQVGWASCEGTNLQLGSGPGQSGMTMETFLAKMFNHGGTLVNIFSWGIGGEANKHMDFRVVTEGEEALRAYRKFLKGEPLIEAKTEALTLLERLPPKIHRIQKELPAWIEKSGNRERAAALMQKLDGQLKAKNFEEAEATADSILKLMGASAEPPAVSAEAVGKRISGKVERVKEGLQKWAASGRDPSAILKTMQEKVGPLFDAGKIIEGEAELDRVLEQLGQPKAEAQEKEPRPATGQAASPRASEPRYLVFWGPPEKVLELKERIGAVGDGKSRLLAFGLANPTFDGEPSLPARIRGAFQAARKDGIPVLLHFDFHIEWKERPDLWNSFDPKLPGYNPAHAKNVEWSDWKGTPNRVRYLNWGVPQRIAPQMCVTSPVIRQEITRLVSQVIGPALKPEIDRLKKEGQEYLFAGILVGSEPGIEDYSHPDPETAKLMAEDGTPKAPLGFNALVSRGYSEKHPPQDFRRALAEVNADFVAFCAKQFVDVGIPSSRLYTHVAAPAPQESTTAPIWIAFNTYSRPGWTTYPVGPLAADFDAIYSELKKHGSPAWGGVEANVGMPGSWVRWEAYLARHFNHGATLVGINCGATGSTLPDLLTKSAFSDEAVAAYKKFLSGAPLSEKEPTNDNPQARLQGKVRKLEAGMQKWQQEGRDLSPVGKILQEFDPLMRQGKLPEAEAVLDRAIERLRGKTMQGP